MDVELHDWENLDDSTSLLHSHTTTYLDGIERDSDGAIKSDYFSINSHNTYFANYDVTDQISVVSDNPSWIDPVCDTNYTKTKPIGEVWTTDGSDDGRYEDSNNDKLGFDEIESVSDSCEVKSKRDGYDETDDSGEEDTVEDDHALIEDVKERNRWWKWKVPAVDLLKYCLFVKGGWTVSVAAAVMMGVVILGRRLYKMKMKTRSLQQQRRLMLTIDDDHKKASQVMNRVARLNEAFSVVKRAPIIRPSLPGTGIAPWPMMVLR